MRIPTKQQIIAWARTNPRLAIGAGAVCAGVLVAALASIGILLFAPKPDLTPFDASPAPVAEEPTGRNWLDGTPDDGEPLRPFAVMIENHGDSRPQSGLSAAKLVFEAPVEGGITRFLAVYAASGTVREIGPVRSARPYYLDWVLELGADYVHVGGSPEAFTKLARLRLHDIDEFAYGTAAFWRSSRRYAPHNTYTSVELLNGVREERAWAATSTAAPWRYVDPQAPEERPTSTPNLVIDFSSPTYRVEWRYQHDDNAWRRFQAGAPHADVDGTPILAANVAVIRTETQVLDAVGRLKLRTVGSGKAWVFRDGRMITGRWKKLAAEERIRFETVDGKEIPFVPGPTWIEVTTADMPTRFGAPL
ncbi:DUF3048 domain-containing protein [Patescibacteria group bacterium]|nr:MAG: DUF3048 domain-containing protein [Patescibacteria group bacterium]